MKLLEAVSILACVIGFSAVQILFKKAGLEFEKVGTWGEINVLKYIFVALAISGGATLAWISILRHSNLSRSYLFFALCFVIVPIAGHFIFNEKIQINVLIGLALIVGGVVVANAL
jgi:drug/metabolite transporter (DMT)-like permease